MQVITNYFPGGKVQDRVEGAFGSQCIAATAPYDKERTVPVSRIKTAEFDLSQPVVEQQKAEQ